VYNNSNNIGGNTIAMVLAGGKGERLSPLTMRRAKPSVAFGGKYKIIDFVLSNLFNSGIKRCYILTQYRAYSLNKHIRESWGKWTGLGEFFVAISPETSSDSEEWFKGTADAILQYLRFVETANADYVAVFGGDHIYKMDVTQMINFHRMNRADITIAALEVPKEEASRFGVFSVDEDSRVTAFNEKPDDPETIPGRDTCYASMGNYIFPTKRLIEVLLEGKKLESCRDTGESRGIPWNRVFTEVLNGSPAKARPVQGFREFDPNVAPPHTQKRPLEKTGCNEKLRTSNKTQAPQRF